MQRKLTGWLRALLVYGFNHLINKVPFFAVRHAFFRFLGGTLGEGSSLFLGVTVVNPRNVTIGAHTIVNRNVMLDGRRCPLVIGDNVDIAEEVRIWTMEHDPHSDTHAPVGKPVAVENHVWIGSRAIVLPGVCLRRGCVVASGAVVRGDVGPSEIVGGVPAKVIGQRRSGLAYQLDYQPWFE